MRYSENFEYLILLIKIKIITNNSSYNYILMENNNEY